jgi:hypothetical protein
MEYKVETKFNKDLIKQSLIFSNGEGVISSQVSNIIKLQEQGVKDALIKLGWTPPVEDSK